MTCGRVAGRIKGAKFIIGDILYKLPVNNNDACLNGGRDGFNRLEWDAEIILNKSLSDYTNLPEGMED